MSKETVGELAYRRVREDIVFGRLPPASKLKLEKLKSDYGVSISTLRESLSRLATEGLVLAEGMRGFEVTPVSANDLREIAELRLLLECHALSKSFARGDMEWEGRVVASHHKLSLMERQMLANDRTRPETWKGYDREFHHELISACGSQALLETHDSVYDRYLRYQMVAVIFRGQQAADEHQKLLEAALRRDAETAMTILKTHIQDCLSETFARGILS